MGCDGVCGDDELGGLMTYIDDIDHQDSYYDKYPLPGDVISGEEMLQIAEGPYFKLRILELFLEGRLDFEAGFEEIPEFWDRLYDACLFHPDITTEHVQYLIASMQRNGLLNKYFASVMQAGAPEIILGAYDHFLDQVIIGPYRSDEKRLEQVATWLLLRDLDYEKVRPQVQLELIRTILRTSFLPSDLVEDLKLKSTELLLMVNWDV
jgi:hypothetical protein